MKDLTALTLDGHQVDVVANIGRPFVIVVELIQQKNMLDYID